MTPILALFDVDGTLFLTHDPIAGLALRDTLAERYAVELPEDAIDGVDHAGETALHIGRLVLLAAGIQEPASLRDWCEYFADRYRELLAIRTPAPGGPPLMPSRHSKGSPPPGSVSHF